MAESAWLAGYREDKEIKWFSMRALEKVFLQPWGRGRFLLIKRSEVVIFEKSSPRSCHSSGKEELPAIVADGSSVNQKAAKNTLPAECPLEQKCTSDSAPGHRGELGTAKPLPPPPCPPPGQLLPSPDPNVPSSQVKDSCEAERHSCVFTATDSNPNRSPASLPQGRLGARRGWMRQAGRYFGS